MCQRQVNTCEKRKKKKYACARGKRIHAKKEKRGNRHVSVAREYMRKEKKEEIGMCQRYGNTYEKVKNED